MELFLSCLYSFIACVAYCIVCNIRGRSILPASIGGAVGWFFFTVSSGIHNDIFQYFIAAIAISIYSEIFARIRKVPVTVYLICSLLPLVPGGGIYYTMEYCIRGESDAFIQTGMHTTAIFGALALGILLVSSTVRLWKIIRHTGF